MIGKLPTMLNINGIERAIRSDFRIALNILQAFNDPELKETEKGLVMLECLYEDSFSNEEIQEAIEKAVWFLDGGTTEETKHKQSKKVMDWEQDEQLIFSAVNKIAGYETREKDYIHWWTFLGFFNEIGEGLFSTVINIRQKKNKGKKLEKYEQDFYRENKEMIDIKTKYTAEEQAEIDKLNKLFE
jgi:hypothetical protein